jgi:hypothetical protein
MLLVRLDLWRFPEIQGLDKDFGRLRQRAYLKARVT